MYSIMHSTCCKIMILDFLKLANFQYLEMCMHVILFVSVVRIDNHVHLCICVHDCICVLVKCMNTVYNDMCCTLC